MHLSQQKSSYIKKLQKQWSARQIPIYNEKDIRELNLEFHSNQMNHEADNTERGFDAQHAVDSKSWILKQSSKWLGWNPQINAYFTDRIYFGGDLDFPCNLESLVISNFMPKSINLIWTIRKFRHKGIDMGLTEEDFIQVFLILAIPLIFTSLSRHSLDVDALFLELISNMNLDKQNFI